MTSASITDVLSWAGQVSPIGPEKPDGSRPRFEVCDGELLVLEEPGRVPRPSLPLTFALGGLLVLLGVPTVGVLVGMLGPVLLYRVQLALLPDAAVKVRIGQAGITDGHSGTTVPWRRVRTVASASAPSGHGVWVTPEGAAPRMLVEFAEVDEAATFADMLRAITKG